MPSGLISQIVGVRFPLPLPNYLLPRLERGGDGFKTMNDRTTTGETRRASVAQKSLTFKEVLSCFKQANKVINKNGDVDIEVWIGTKMYRIVSVGQFNFVPTVTLTLADEPELAL